MNEHITETLRTAGKRPADIFTRTLLMAMESLYNLPLLLLTSPYKAQSIGACSAKGS